MYLLDGGQDSFSGIVTAALLELDVGNATSPSYKESTCTIPPWTSCNMFLIARKRIHIVMNVMCKWPRASPDLDAWVEAIAQQDTF